MRRTALGSAVLLAALFQTPAMGADATPSTPLTDRAAAPAAAASRGRALRPAVVVHAPPGEYVPLPINEDADPHMCQVEFDPNRALRLHAMIGDTIVLRFREGETITNGVGTFSDTASIQRQSVGNNVFLKAMRPMAPQPIQILMTSPDGPAHMYVLEFSTGDRGCYSIQYRFTAEDAAAKRAEQAKVGAMLHSRMAERALAPGVATPPGQRPAPVLVPPPGANTNYQVVGRPGP